MSHFVFAKLILPDLLLQKERVTAPELARRFEVSRRTIQRDVESLCRVGIPLVTTQGAGGGISIMEGYRMDRTLITAPEMQAILAGLRSLDSVSGTRRYAQLMEKLSPENTDLIPGGAHMLIDLSSWYKSDLAPKLSSFKGRSSSLGSFNSTNFRPKERHSGPSSLITYLSMVLLVCVGLVPHRAGVSPIQTGPHDRACQRRAV